jgi:hypothetical protein
MQIHFIALLSVWMVNKLSAVYRKNMQKLEEMEEILREKEEMDELFA